MSSTRNGKSTLVEAPHESIILGDTHVRVEQEHGCFRKLTWKCRLSRTVTDVVGLEGRLMDLGYTNVSKFDFLRELRHWHGHSLVMVRSTGRIQIRLSYLLAEEQRPRMALNIARDVAAAQRSNEPVASSS